MCGIAGLIYRGSSGDIGREMTRMLQSLKHRGPDSTGYALYGMPKDHDLVLRFKVAEQEDMSKGYDIHHKVKERKAEVDRRIAELGGKIRDEDEATEYAYRYHITYDGDRRKLADYVEDVEGAEILSLGTALELIKDLGDAKQVQNSIASLGSKVRMRSATLAWRQNRMLISVPPIRTGPIRSPTCPWSITGSSRITGAAAEHSSAKVTALSRTAIPS